MKLPWRKIGLVSLFAACALAGGGWVATHPVHRDPFKFLEGRRAVHGAVTRPGSFAPKEYRSYTWEQPWQEVATKARKEFLGGGFVEQKTEEGASWLAGEFDAGPCGTGSTMEVYIVPGRALPMTQLGETTDEDPQWTTVLVGSDLDESWVNVIRYTFFSMPEE